MGEYGGPATSCQPQAWATIKSWLFFLITLAQCNQYGLRPSSFFFSRKDASAFLVRKYAVDLEQAELEAKQLGRAVEEAEQLAAMEAVAVAVALEAVADWEAEAEREEALAAREAAAREEATATPDGRAADGQSKVFDPGGCVALAAAGGEAVAVHPQRASRSRR